MVSQAASTGQPHAVRPKWNPQTLNNQNRQASASNFISNQEKPTETNTKKSNKKNSKNPIQNLNKHNRPKPNSNVNQPSQAHGVRVPTTSSQPNQTKNA